MEPISTPSGPALKKKSSWGLLIGLFLILSIIVSSAYYAFTQRLTPDQTMEAEY